MDGRFWMTLLVGFVGNLGIYTVRRAKLMFLFLYSGSLCLVSTWYTCRALSSFIFALSLYQGLFSRKFMVCVTGQKIVALGDSK